MGRHKQFDREEVLDEAVQVFWKKGFKDTSLQDLEKATGVNKSGLYSEFKDKDDLFTEGLRRYVRTSGLMEILGRKPLGLRNLEDFLLASGKREGQKGCLVVNSIREFTILPGPSRAVIQEHLLEMKAAVRENIRAANPRLDADAAAELFLTYNSGMCLRHNLGEVKRLGDQVRGFLELLGT